MNNELKINTVEIPESVSTYVERCFFEWDGIQKILAYITGQNALNEHLDYYTKLALEKNFVLEKAKAEAINTYVIPIVGDKKISYEFDFDNYLIKFWEE